MYLLSYVLPAGVAEEGLLAGARDHGGVPAGGPGGGGASQVLSSRQDESSGAPRGSLAAPRPSHTGEIP